eukprot:1450339-Pyramimonas_sp.AAC.1
MLLGAEVVKQSLAELSQEGHAFEVQSSMVFAHVPQCPMTELLLSSVFKHVYVWPGAASAASFDQLAVHFGIPVAAGPAAGSVLVAPPPSAFQLRASSLETVAVTLRCCFDSLPPDARERQRQA